MQAHPGTLHLDLERLQELIGAGHDLLDARSRLAAVGHLVRPLARDMAQAYLDGGHDVVLSQDLAGPEQAYAGGGAGLDAPRQVPRLIHLNGPPAIGKSTLARRFAEDHPGTLNLDVDRLRTMVGGWQDRFAETGELVRPMALAMARSHLSRGRDVVFPQLLARLTEIERFAAATAAGGGALVEVMLSDTRPDQRASSIARFATRGEADDDPWHAQVQAIVAASGGERLLGETYDRLVDVLAARPSYVVVPSAPGDVDGTYAGLIAALR